MQAEERWKKARVRFELREGVLVTHWVSSRSKGDGLHVMIGDYLWRERKGRVEKEREERQKESTWVM